MVIIYPPAIIDFDYGFEFSEGPFLFDEMEWSFHFYVLIYQKKTLFIDRLFWYRQFELTNYDLPAHSLSIKTSCFLGQPTIVYQLERSDRHQEFLSINACLIIFGLSLRSRWFVDHDLLSLSLRSRWLVDQDLLSLSLCSRWLVDKKILSLSLR